MTNITTLDNVRTFVGNAKILGDNIQNFTAHPYRRVDLLAQLDNSVDHVEAIRLLRERLKGIPNVVAVPTPDIEILTFTPLGPVLPQRSLLAGLLRHEPLHSRGGRRGEIPCAAATRLHQRDEVVTRLLPGRRRARRRYARSIQRPPVHVPSSPS